MCLEGIGGFCFSLVACGVLQLRAETSRSELPVQAPVQYLGDTLRSSGAHNERTVVPPVCSSCQEHCTSVRSLKGVRSDLQDISLTAVYICWGTMTASSHAQVLCIIILLLPAWGALANVSTPGVHPAKPCVAYATVSGTPGTCAGT